MTGNIGSSIFGTGHMLRIKSRNVLASAALILTMTKLYPNFNWTKLLDPHHLQ